MTLYTITTFGCREYLRHTGRITGGELISIRPFRLQIADIQEVVASHFNFPVREMKSARRKQPIVLYRQVAMYLAREKTPRSLPDIGRRFGGRDHTTVIHAIRQIERLRAIDADLDGDITAIERKLEAA